MEDLRQRVEDAVHALTGRMQAPPRVGMIMGSGLGEADGLLRDARSVPYAEIPHFPRSTAPGHEGRLVTGEVAGIPVVLLQGRFHYYEGYSTREITFPVRVIRALGAHVLVVTNAAGGLNPLWEPGDLMVIADHIHLIPENPLRGIQDEQLGERFPDLSRAYDPELIRLAESVALASGIGLKKGVYVAIAGPSLETPAETRLLRAAGADAVGMSTTPEVIVARSVGLRVLGLSVVSNVNRPDCMAPIRVEEILSTSREAVPRLMTLLEGMLRGMAERSPQAGPA